MKADSSIEPEAERHRRAAVLDRDLMAATLHFSETWEDPRSDLRALNPQPGERLLAITAGGCTPLSLLTTDPSRVISVDYNPAQTYLAELKMAALRHLPHHAVAPFLLDGRDCEDIFPLLRSDLGPEATAYWQERQAELATGVARTGVASRIFYRIGKFLQKAFPQRVREQFFEFDDLDEQAAFYRRYFHFPILRGLSSFVGVWLSRPAMLKRAFGADYFPYATVDNVPAHLWQRIEHVMSRVPASDSYFLARVLLDHDLESAEGTPPYLQEEHFPRVRERLDRLSLVTAPVDEALRGLDTDSIDGFQLSNVFEWMPEDKLGPVFAEILRVARPGARLFLRNLFTHRDIPETARSELRIDTALAEQLHDADRSFIYSRFVAATVEKGPEKGREMLPKSKAR